MKAQERYETQNKALDKIPVDKESDLWWKIKDCRKQLDIAWAQSYNLAINNSRAGEDWIKDRDQHYEQLTLNISKWIKQQLSK